LSLPGLGDQLDIPAVVARTAELVVQQTINIPRILVAPQGEVRSGFKTFALELGALNYQSPSEELWIQYLRTGGMEVLGLGKGGIEEARLEDYIVSGLVDFDDVAYDNHADLLYSLATQIVEHFRSYLSEEDTRKVLRMHQREIAHFIHVQMQQHYWEEAIGYEVVVSKGFTELKPSAYAASATEPSLDFQQSPADKANMAKYLFSGFKRCLYAVQKFQSEAERILAVILDRETEKWFKPAKGQFQIFYRSGADHLEYQPDFVAEAADTIYMLEAKARNQMEDVDVLAKRDAAVAWCQRASTHAATCGGKPWKYALIAHDVIATNMTTTGLLGISGS
jgi:type III restriction enzyme